MKHLSLPRLDTHPELRRLLMPYCRVEAGELWHDPQSGHTVGCLDATDGRAIQQLMAGEKATLAVQDPPYNSIAFEQKRIGEFMV